MKSLLLLLTLALLCSAILYPSPLPESRADILTMSKPRMWAEKKEAFLGETILLRFKTPHPQFLGVIDPDGHFFYLVFPLAQCVGKLTPLVDSQAFIGLDRLEISTSGLKADPYRYGVEENQPVFTKSGTYAFLMGENLHADDPTEMDRVKVKYNRVARSAMPAILVSN